MRGIIRELEDIDADATVIDLEAGLEHLKRGTPRHTDALVVVAEPYFRSLQTAATTAELGRELGIPEVGMVANKVRDDRDREAIREVAESRQIRLVASVPFDEAVVRADRQPAALIDVAPDAPSVAAIATMVQGLNGDVSGRD